MATSVEDDADDIWDFSTSGGPAQAEDIKSATSDSDGEELKMLPASRRRKLQRRLECIPDAIPLDSNSESDGSDSDLEIVGEVKRVKKEAVQPTANEFDLLEVIPQQPTLRQPSQRGAVTEAALLRNRAALERVREMVAAPLPEPVEVDGDAEPVQAQANCSENARVEAAPEHGKIVVKLSMRQQTDPLKLRIGLWAPFARMFERFREIAVKKGWIQADTALKFMFDGEELGPEGTAHGAEVEEDCVIEVYW